MEDCLKETLGLLEGATDGMRNALGLSVGDPDAMLLGSDDGVVEGGELGDSDLEGDTVGTTFLIQTRIDVSLYDTGSNYKFKILIHYLRLYPCSMKIVQHTSQLRKLEHGQNHHHPHEIQ